jgi:hypothetical protein
LAVLGLLLALLGGWLLRKKKTLLPVQFGAPAPLATPETSVPPTFRQKIFAVHSFALFGFVNGLVSLPLSSVLFRSFSTTSSSEMRPSVISCFFGVQLLLYALPLFLLAVWTLGKNRRAQLLESARLPAAGVVGLALVLPFVAHRFPHVVAYAFDRVAWAQHWNSSATAPLLSLYLHIPALGPYLLVYAVVAAFSEWSWRGCMQPQFIRIFGISRGNLSIRNSLRFCSTALLSGGDRRFAWFLGSSRVRNHVGGSLAHHPWVADPLCWLRLASGTVCCREQHARARQ